jgi:hypothetical protein
MGYEKFPTFNEIPWVKINEIRVSADSGIYSFEFDLHGKKQKMTITISPDSTTYTLSKNDGSPIVHATQKGTELSVVDFTTKPSKLPKWVKKLQKKHSYS